MNRLIEIILSDDDPDFATRLSMRFAETRRWTDLLAHAEALDQFRRSAGQSLPSCSCVVLSVGNLSLPFAGPTRRHSIGFDSVCRLRASVVATFRRSDRHISCRPKRRTGPAMVWPARWPRPTTNSAFKHSPTRSAAACERCAATSGCFDSDIPPIIPLRMRNELLQADPLTRARCRCFARRRRFGWISRTVRGATSSSSAWIFPKARGY